MHHAAASVPPSHSRFSAGDRVSWPEQHDPQAVQHLSGGWIERRQVLDVGEPQRGDMAGLRERRGPGQVVPQRVERPHADVVGLKRGRRPLGQHRDRGDDRDTRAGDLKAAAIRGAAAQSGMPRLTFGGEPGGAESDGHARCGDRPEREPADRSRAPRGSRSAWRARSRPRRGAASAPAQSGSHRRRIETAPSSSEPDQEQRDRAQRVAPGAHRAPGETLPRAGDRLGTLELDPMTGRRLGRPVVAVLAALAIAVLLAGCGGGGETHQPTATQLPLVDGRQRRGAGAPVRQGGQRVLRDRAGRDRPALPDLDGPGRRGARQAPQATAGPVARGHVGPEGRRLARPQAPGDLRDRLGRPARRGPRVDPALAQDHAGAVAGAVRPGTGDVD